MSKFRYEFGKRWDTRVPRSTIRWLINCLHVGTSDDEIAADITRRCKSLGFTPAIIRQSIAYALECHKRNRELYQHVMKGN